MKIYEKYGSEIRKLLGFNDLETADIEAAMFAIGVIIT